ncbi:polysaccharide deacetylase family protein [Streptomyces sp. V3I7]|uniref:polysaccharide deacetylase family protein n=1 Tax=Streptomyces sp. V3I7 TaxID=3042278 RepID=UPI00278681AB|nr:polysaccharide deacetylase family protein [Streptomyces sp. V3I7]MDQ0992530.1 peptidoglycan/xylan/chitin deacetylase (PgdA/CDA1 family) [Streptomyces sp. V3I7]
MRAVRQNDKYGALVRKAAVRGGIAVLALVAVMPGCSASGRGTDVLPAPGQQPLKAPAAPALDSYAARLGADHDALVAAADRWGLGRVPLLPPPPPAHKPRITVRAGFEVRDQEELDLPPVFTTIPTRQKVVFLTLDDGAEKDPGFLRMMSDLRIPYTAFLTDESAGDDYGYFRRMRSQGVTLDNHTLHHPYLPGLSYEEQRDEICGMQDVMEKQFGKRPTVFRPPYGNYDRDTLLAARSCGIKYAPIWSEEVFADHWEYREDDRNLHPGDIVLSHFQDPAEWNGTMTQMVRRFLNRVTRDGFAVARLEDYL